MLDFFIFFPNIIQSQINEKIQNKEEKLEEIRFRVSKNIALKLIDEEIIVEHILSTSEILEILQRICENSIYTYQNEIAEGFVTVKGGHRVGITGSCVVENGCVKNIRYINSLNFRIAKQILNCSDEIIELIVDKELNIVKNTLIVAPPCSGKTTILRDIARKIATRF